MPDKNNVCSPNPYNMVVKELSGTEKWRGEQLTVIKGVNMTTVSYAYVWVTNNTFVKINIR